MKTKLTNSVIMLFSIIVFFSFSKLEAQNSELPKIYIPTQYPTIQQGIDAGVVLNGAEIIVSEGVYNENLTIFDNIYVISSTLSPENTIIDAGGNQDVVVFEGCVNGGIIGFSILNGGTNGQFAGIKVTSNQAPVIAKNIITQNKNGIKIQGDAHPLIVNNTIVYNDSNGIIAGGNSPAQIINNIIAFNSGNGIEMNGNALDLLDYNCVYGNSIDYNNINQGICDIVEDPIFVSETDFHLLTNSPCIQACYDFEGNLTDIGAFGGSSEFRSVFVSDFFDSSENTIYSSTGVNIIKPEVKLANDQTIITYFDYIAAAVEKKDLMLESTLKSYIIFSTISTDVTIIFDDSNYQSGTFQIYKFDLETNTRTLISNSNQAAISSSLLNGIWIIEGVLNTENNDIANNNISVYPNPCSDYILIT